MTILLRVETMHKCFWRDASIGKGPYYVIIQLQSPVPIIHQSPPPPPPSLFAWELGIMSTNTFIDFFRVTPCNCVEGEKQWARWWRRINDELLFFRFIGINWTRWTELAILMACFLHEEGTGVSFLFLDDLLKRRQMLIYVSISSEIIWHLGSYQWFLPFSLDLKSCELFNWFSPCHVFVSKFIVYVCGEE